MNPVAAAIAVAQEASRRLKAERVVIQRDDLSVEVEAIQGTTAFRMDTVEQGNVLVRSVDFLIDVRRYEFAGQLVTPEEGDRVLVQRPQSIETYECLPFGAEPAWRFSDSFQQQYRIHTKRVANA